MLWSDPYGLRNEHVHEEDVRFGTPGSSRDALVSFAERLGIPTWFYSDRTIQNGALSDEDVKILFLPQAEALPDATAKKLRQWVESGGTLVGDVHIGLRNRRGAPREEGVVDELFGIGQDLAGNPTTLSFPLPGFTSLTADKMIVDAALEPVDAEVTETVGEEEVPVVLEKDTGNGKTIFLNMALGRLLNNYANAKETKLFLENILSNAGVWTGLEAPRDYFVTRFRGEGYDLLSCRIRGRGKPGKTLRLGRRRYVYDVRNGESLGQRTELVPSEHGGAESLFTVVPRPIAPFSVEFPDEVQAGEETTLQIQPEFGDEYANARRLFRVRVLRPDGADDDYIHNLNADPAYIPALEDFVWTQTQPIEIKLPFAYNRQPGAYTLQVTDILSGMTKTVEFDIGD